MGARYREDKVWSSGFIKDADGVACYLACDGVECERRRRSLEFRWYKSRELRV